MTFPLQVIFVVLVLKKNPLVFAAFCSVLIDPLLLKMFPNIVFTLSVFLLCQSEVADSI